MKKGFTLLEMIVVVLIVALLAAWAVNFYGRFIEHMRVSEVDTLVGTMIAAQERNRLTKQTYTRYWHQLDASPIAVRRAKSNNDFANGSQNTIFYTRGGATKEKLNNGFAVSFEQDATDRWFIVAQRVGTEEYTYQLVRAFDDTKTICVPVWENEKDVENCMWYMGVEDQSELLGNPMIPLVD